MSFAPTVPPYSSQLMEHQLFVPGRGVPRCTCYFLWDVLGPFSGRPAVVAATSKPAPRFLLRYQPFPRVMGCRRHLVWQQPGLHRLGSCPPRLSNLWINFTGTCWGGCPGVAGYQCTCTAYLSASTPIGCVGVGEWMGRWRLDDRTDSGSLVNS